MNYDRAFDRLIGNEGGYSNNPNDPGGETMWGVTAKVARASGYLGLMRDMPRETAKSIYKAQYWDACQCGQFDGGVAFQVFDAAVNHGNGQAIKFLQFAAGVTEDGQVGAQTIGSVRAAVPAQLIMRFMSRRLHFWTSLATFQTFGRGWTNRGADNLLFAAGDI